MPIQTVYVKNLEACNPFVARFGAASTPGAALVGVGKFNNNDIDQA